ncbi:MAG TPA: M36 family metallopeptidase [Jiangellaceae bacterium]|nr:M36 family metallopeptidase [Jiangellaceae bacterium]
MRRSFVTSGLAAVVTLGVLAVGNSPGSLAAPDNESPSAPGEAGLLRAGAGQDKDNREGRVEPTARQRALAAAVDARARFNNLGTPGTLTSTGRPLASGLPVEPVAAARAYIAANRDLLGLTPRAANSLQVVTVTPMGEGAAVLLQQRFGNLAAGYDGLLVVGVRDGAVYHVSGSLARDAAQPQPATLSQQEAARIAARDAGVGTSAVRDVELVAVPTPEAGARAAYQVLIIDGEAAAEPVAFNTYIDARDGTLLVREDIVDYDVDNPEWDVFPNTPPVDYSSTDTRVRWCFAPGPGCDEVVGTPASPLAWDVDPSNLRPSETTVGNNAIAVHNWFTNNPFKVGHETATPSPTREYAYAWTNQWLEEKCSPAVFETPQRNDIDAARANLFAGHNRMHDWSYHLGFTETTFNLQDDNFNLGGKGNDPEQGNAQAGGVTGGPPTFAARDNANQITPPDGQRPITNMYLWQPIAGAFYAPCVDGDYDMTVIAHEYTHAITNRMVAGPKAGLSSPQGMSESWSDLLAMEYLAEHGYAQPGIRAFTIGEYVTQDAIAGIRNYNMSASPLNYSSVDYDFVGLQVHASGELWSAANFDIRSAMIDKYGAGTAAVQKSCANGQTPVTQCPGNRRWVQLVFDSFLLMAQSQVSMVDARDALLAADFIRFNGVDLDLMWNAFAKRGLGENAVSNGHTDPNPTPSFASPFANEATLTFSPEDESGQPVEGAQLFVGRYQARAVAVADTNPGTALTDSVSLVPGSYEFVARAPGHGLVRIGPVTVSAGQQLDLAVHMPTNLASAAAGATAAGDGVNIARLIDDNEATNWASIGAPVAGKGVVVDLAGDRHRVTRVQVSAMLRPAITGDPDPGTQNRFSALRQFRVLACNAVGSVDCTDADDYTPVFTSTADAFPSVAPRPRAPELILRTFDIPDVNATHLRFEVVTNQCTGAPDYAGEQDADPRAGTDCRTNSPQGGIVRAAEFQAFAD